MLLARARSTFFDAIYAGNVNRQCAMLEKRKEKLRSGRLLFDSIIHSDLLLDLKIGVPRILRKTIDLAGIGAPVCRSEP